MINITHFRIKPLASASGHGRYITVTPERVLVSVGVWPLPITVINEEPAHFRYDYVTAVSPTPRTGSGLKYPLVLLESSTVDTIFFKAKAETAGVVIKICVKHLRGPP
jgi:hypothetical protein